MKRGLQRRTWRTFGSRDGGRIAARIDAGAHARCPSCGVFLEAQPSTRLRSVLPPGVSGYDLDCRECRRFLPRVRHTERSLYYLRVRRMAAAIRNA